MKDEFEEEAEMVCFCVLVFTLNWSEMNMIYV